jgi:two-component system NarL family response regulator
VSYFKRYPTLENTRPPAGRAPAGPIGHAHKQRTESEPEVLIASSVAGLRKLWRQAIQGFATAEVTEHAQLVRSLAHRKPAVLLLDLHLPHLGGMGSVAALQRLRPATKIVVLTSRPDEQEGVVALKMGARGYCDRGIAPVLLGKALKAVQNGEIWVGRKLTSHLLEELSALTEAQMQKGVPTDMDSRLTRLTPRERETVHLLSAGATNKEIAQRLAVTERTVKAHLTAVFRKLGISGRLQAALFVLDHSRPAPRRGRYTTKVQLTD